MVTPNLSDSDRAVLSKVYSTVTASLSGAKKHFQKAESHIHDRHMKDARNSLTSAVSMVRGAEIAVEDLRVRFGLEDPKEIRRQELLDIAKKAVEGWQALSARKQNESDAFIISAIDQGLAKYDQQLQAVSADMREDGWSTLDIISACDKTVPVAKK